MNEDELERTSVVANCVMNRQRGLEGPNSYEKELGFSIRDYMSKCDAPSWLDLCCGEGRALEAASGLGGFRLVGVDLVERGRAQGVEWHTTSLRGFETAEKFDLVTCVHGLHYLGDKLGALEKISGWLKPEGEMYTHIDLSHLFISGKKSAARTILAEVRGASLEYSRSRHLIYGCPSRKLDFGLSFEKADPAAGPNYTGQPAVGSYYRSPR